VIKGAGAGRLGAVLLPLALACAHQRPGDASHGWDYEVTATPQLDRLDVTLCFHDAIPRRLVAEEEGAAGYILSPRAVANGHPLTVEPDQTVTFGLPKVGMYQAPASGKCGRVQVIDIGDPAAPRLRGWVNLPDDLRFQLMSRETAIAASGSSAFFMARYRALAVVETPDPDAPSMRRIWAERSGPVAVAAFTDVSGSMACVADWNGRLTIVRPPFAADVAGVPASAAAVALTLAPNPCNPRTTIAFTLVEAGPVSVNVFDVRGRLVRRLHQGGLEAGPHNLPWSGDDERGRPVAAGVYVVRVEGAGWAQSTRVTLVR